MNIWTKPQDGDAKKAVLVYIYGGDFKAGGSNNKGYNGETFADEEDVVIVTFK